MTNREEHIANADIIFAVDHHGEPWLMWGQELCRVVIATGVSRPGQVLMMEANDEDALDALADDIAKIKGHQLQEGQHRVYPMRWQSDN